MYFTAYYLQFLLPKRLVWLLAPECALRGFRVYNRAAAPNCVFDISGIQKNRPQCIGSFLYDLKTNASLLFVCLFVCSKGNSKASKTTGETSKASQNALCETSGQSNAATRKRSKDACDITGKLPLGQLVKLQASALMFFEHVTQQIKRTCARPTYISIDIYISIYICSYIAIYIYICSQMCWSLLSAIQLSNQA